MLIDIVTCDGAKTPARIFYQLFPNISVNFKCMLLEKAKLNRILLRYFCVQILQISNLNSPISRNLRNKITWPSRGVENFPRETKVCYFDAYLSKVFLEDVADGFVFFGRTVNGEVELKIDLLTVDDLV